VRGSSYRVKVARPKSATRISKSVLSSTPEIRIFSIFISRWTIFLREKKSKAKRIYSIMMRAYASVNYEKAPGPSITVINVPLG
jgi:hypothetical protein